jgi:hypothetical protein
MDLTDTHEQIEIGTPAAREQQQFLLCEGCRAPVERDQRYCVQCGARQTHAPNPAVNYFAAAARRTRGGSGYSQGTGALRAPVFGLFFVLLPLAVAVGVLVGRSGSASSNNDKLIAALLNQRPAAGSVSPTAPVNAATTSSGNLPSDFALGKGFVIKLTTLPVQGTDQSAVARAEQEARAKGAAQVGLINPKEFSTTPSQGAGNYLIYSGEFKKRSDAEKVLAKLKLRFPGAAVIAVASTGASSATGSAPVVARTSYGTVHQVAGSKPTAQQIQQDKKVVQKINREVGKNYVNAQRGLPDTIAVTGNGTGNSSSSSTPSEGPETP